MKQPKAQSLNLAAWVSVAIVLTVALVGTRILIAVTVSTSYEGEMSSSQEQIGADYFGIRPQHDSGGRPTGPTDRAEIAGIAGISRVALASDDISLPSISVTNQGEKRSTTGFSLAKTEPSFFPLRHLAVSAGRLFDAADGADQVAVIGPDLAAAKGWTVGDKVSHPALDTTYEIVGVLNRTDASLSGFEAFGKFNELALIPLEAPLRLNANYIPPEMSENLNSDRPTLWVSVDQGIALTSLTETVRDRLAELTSQSLYVLSGKPIAITYQHIKDQTSVSLWQVTAIVAAIGLVNISGLIMMHLFLNAREVGIKRAFGASAESIRLTYVLRYLWLSVLGAVLAVLLSAALVPSFARALGTDVTFSASRLVLGLVLILATGPLSSLLPSTLAARLSPVSAIRDQAGWGIGRRRFDLRQLLVAFAFGTAMGAVLFVSQFGLSSVENVDRYLRSAGSDLLVVSQPPPGSTSVIPRLTDGHYSLLEETAIPGVNGLCYLASGRTVASIDQSSFVRATLHATSGDVLGTRGFSLSGGRWPSHPGEAVLGAKVAVQLNLAGDPVGQTISLGEDGTAYRVVGLLERRPASIADLDYDRDESVYVYGDETVANIALEPLSPSIYLLTAPGTAQTGIRQAVTEALLSIDPTAAGLVIENPLGDLLDFRRLQTLFSFSLLALSALAMLSAITGIAALAIVQSKEMSKTLAVLRACGATEREVLVRILLETLRLVVPVGISGLLLGHLAFAAYAVRQGLPLVGYGHYPLVISGTVVAVMFALVSAYLPASLVAKRPPAGLLR